MFLLLIGGVETSSSRIINAIGGDGPSLWELSIFWIAIASALVLFVATNKISAGGFSFQASRESVMAAFVGAIYIIFASDMYSIVSKIKSVECAVGAGLLSCGSWEYWVIWAIIMPLLIGFGISVIQFVGGSD